METLGLCLQTRRCVILSNVYLYANFLKGINTLDGALSKNPVQVVSGNSLAYKVVGNTENPVYYVKMTSSFNLFGYAVNKKFSLFTYYHTLDTGLFDSWSIPVGKESCLRLPVVNRVILQLIASGVVEGLRQKYFPTVYYYNGNLERLPLQTVTLPMVSGALLLLCVGLTVAFVVFGFETERLSSRNRTTLWRISDSSSFVTPELKQVVVC